MLWVRVVGGSSPFFFGDRNKRCILKGGRPTVPSAQHQHDRSTSRSYGDGREEGPTEVRVREGGSQRGCGGRRGAREDPALPDAKANLSGDASIWGWGGMQKLMLYLSFSMDLELQSVSE